MFIVFEGIDGSGKSTQIFLLAKYLASLDKHAHILLTREPYKNREVRALLRQNESPELKKETLTELFIRDRKEHISGMILPALDKDIIVISDRYKYATISYQAAQGQDMHNLVELQKYMPTPDFVFVIDTDVDTALKRMESDSRSKQKFEKSSFFQDKVRKNYLRLKELLPRENIIIIDGTKSVDEVFEQIKKNFDRIVI